MCWLQKRKPRALVNCILSTKADFCSGVNFPGQPKGFQTKWLVSLRLKSLQFWGLRVCASGERQEQGDPEGLQVRPTDGRFVPNFKLFEKCDVNGTKAHPLFTFLREALLTPSDVATTLMTEPKFVSWYPQGRRLELREVPGRPGRRAHAQVQLKLSDHGP
ncbi:hypothetical protein CB1_000846007 [Camelus ferus]|nr:hypothetical protein CB1_000846007 [Camelus ferus]